MDKTSWIFVCGKTSLNDGEKERIHVYAICSDECLGDASPAFFRLLSNGREVISAGKRVYPDKKVSFCLVNSTPIRKDSNDIVSIGGGIASATFDVNVKENIDGVTCTLHDGSTKLEKI